MGLELQQKLDKIQKYDQCNEDTAKVMGSKEYCLELFKNSQDDFLFWSANDVRAHCGKIQRSIN